MPSPFPCSPVNRDWSWKKTPIEKKKKIKNGYNSLWNVKTKILVYKENLVFIVGFPWCLLASNYVCVSTTNAGGKP